MLVQSVQSRDRRNEAKWPLDEIIGYNRYDP